MSKQRQSSRKKKESTNLRARSAVKSISQPSKVNGSEHASLGTFSFSSVGTTSWDFQRSNDEHTQKHIGTLLGTHEEKATKNATKTKTTERTNLALTPNLFLVVKLNTLIAFRLVLVFLITCSRSCSSIFSVIWGLLLTFRHHFVLRPQCQVIWFIGGARQAAEGWQPTLVAGS